MRKLMIHPTRIRTFLGKHEEYSEKQQLTFSKDDSVVYWMSRDLRLEDNWSLLHAQHLAKSNNLKLIILYLLVPKYEYFTLRHYHFLLKTLESVDRDSFHKNIPFYLIETKNVPETLTDVVNQFKARFLICDQNPMRTYNSWSNLVIHSLSKKSEIPIVIDQVDAHNIVPVWKASNKQEWAAKTIRPKILNLLPEFLTEYPELESMPIENIKNDSNIKFPFSMEKNDNDCLNNWEKVYKESESMKTCDNEIKPVDEFFQPGKIGGLHALEEFLTAKRIGTQSLLRNDPTHPESCSGLSIYLNFGILSAQRIALKVTEFNKKNNMKFKPSCDTFLEELIVRRELSENFCYYNPNYDNLKGGPDWAKLSLKIHEIDKREYLYTYEEFAEGKTHDPIWNAAMVQLRTEGKMHGYMRMYWAKKILEWTNNAEEALKFTLKMNDTFALDGNNPNGYVGIMWSIVGVHDQGWGERPIFGKIRFMNDTGCKRKFDTGKYIRKYQPENDKMNNLKRLKLI